MCVSSCNLMMTMIDYYVRQQINLPVVPDRRREAECGGVGEAAVP